MKKLLAVVLLFSFSSAALALEPRSGLVINLAGGYTPSILATDSGTSYGGYIGYRLSQYFYFEGGYTSLLNQANSGAGTAVSIAGPELAGILRFPINNRVSPFLRAGFTKMSMKNISAGTVTSIENIYGPSYGAGLQFYETDHVSLRVGYTIYNLQTNNDYGVQAGIPVNTSNAYVSLLIAF